MNLDRIYKEIIKMESNIIIALDTLEFIISILRKDCKVHRIIITLSILVNIVLFIILVLVYYSNL